MTGHGIERRLNALEQIAEDMRCRERNELIREELARRAAKRGVTLLPACLERAYQTADRLETLTAAGLSTHEAVRRIAVERELDPDDLIARFDQIKAEHS